MKDTSTIEELKRLSRRIDEQSKTLDILSADREILEDILSRMSAVESAIHLQRSTATENAKNIHADIKEVADVVEAKVGEVSENIDNQTVVVKSHQQSILQKIINKVGGK